MHGLRDACDEIEIVLDNEHGHPVRGERAENPREGLPLDGVEPGGRLVEQQRVRPPASARPNSTRRRAPVDSPAAGRSRTGPSSPSSRRTGPTAEGSCRCPCSAPMRTFSSTVSEAKTASC